MIRPGSHRRKAVVPGSSMGQHGGICSAHWVFGRQDFSETFQGRSVIPNGGSDCCGNCPFNTRNEGRWRSHRLDIPGPQICTIRELPVRDEMHTYYANHPHRNCGRIEVPIGPVWSQYPDPTYYRQIRKLSPDREEVRVTLLALLKQVEETPHWEPEGAYLDDTVIWQIGEFREGRAVDQLRRIAGFSPDMERWGTVQLAQRALEKIEGTLRLEWTQEPEGRPHPIIRRNCG